MCDAPLLRKASVIWAGMPLRSPTISALMIALVSVSMNPMLSISRPVAVPAPAHICMNPSIYPPAAEVVSALMTQSIPHAARHVHMAAKRYADGVVPLLEYVMNQAETRTVASARDAQMGGLRVRMRTVHAAIATPAANGNAATAISLSTFIPNFC